MAFEIFTKAAITIFIVGITAFFVDVLIWISGKSAAKFAKITGIMIAAGITGMIIVVLAAVWAH